MCYYLCINWFSTFLSLVGHIYLCISLFSSSFVTSWSLLFNDLMFHVASFKMLGLYVYGGQYNEYFVVQNRFTSGIRLFLRDLWFISSYHTEKTIVLPSVVVQTYHFLSNILNLKYAKTNGKREISLTKSPLKF